MSDYFTVVASCAAETRVQASRFIAWLAPAQSRSEAEMLVAARAEIFADATHNCYAYRLGTGTQLLAYANDAHEPAGTAGRPMLQVLQTNKLTNVVAVVTRYFGGTKLGLGGLIRAYSGALHAAVALAELQPLIPTRTFELSYQYDDSAGVEKVLRKFEALVQQNEFDAHVRRRVAVSAQHAEEFCALLRELSAGRVQIYETR